MTIDLTDERRTAGLAAEPNGVRIDVDRLSRRVRSGRGNDVTLLDDVSLSIPARELVAIVGPSGAGKTTLLEAIAGIAAATAGSVRFDGVDVHANAGAFRSVLGYVPQDDIIHADLPLERTLRYAARLRLPSATRPTDIDAAVADALAAVGLTAQAGVRVGALSGGQRKRASIAVELLTDPHVFFLDEPTSGLDPLTSAELVTRLRQLADRSATVVFTTHSVDDLTSCDRIVFMTRGGRVGFVGTIDEALAWFEVGSIPDLYALLADPTGAAEPAAEPAPNALPSPAGVDVVRRPVAGAITQWGVLTRRTLEIFVRNRLTLAILLGSPALVVAMFAVLFRPGAFDVDDPSPSSMVMVGFWVVFAAFFFGPTYGLLQIVTERSILRRERLVGLRPGAYLASKVTILGPFLLLVVAAMLAVLRLFERLPDRPLATYASIGTGLLLCAIAALGLGLLTSAIVSTAAQATLALPMLCFPAVLFSGAILPVNLMASAGATLSVAIPSRWAFEAIGHDLGARRILAGGGSPLGQPLLDSYGDAGTLPTGTYWLVLTLFAVAFLGATWAVLAHTSDQR
jgi:ABC-type multidrug transport system ATPase subunit